MMLDTKCNPLGLKFLNPGIEEFWMLTEVLESYKPETWNLQEGEVVLEIGGHTGELSMTLAKQYGCRVVVFEPSPPNNAKLKANIISNGLTDLITLYQIAVTKDGRNVHMHLGKNSGAHHVYGKGPEVKSVTLAQAIQAATFQGKPPRIVVMDCEGAEFELLEDPTPLKGVEMLRGEFHSMRPGDIEALLEKVKQVVPNSAPYMHIPGRVKTGLDGTFTSIYRKNKWRNPETRSGAGSTVANTKNIRCWLPQLIKDRNINSILDAGCGDFNWMKEIVLPVLYIGVDIVPEIIAANEKRYGRKKPAYYPRYFLVQDIVNDYTLPNADLVICRDVLYHLSFGNIFKALNNLSHAAKTFMLLTSIDNITENRDIWDGAYRPLSLLLPPFSFPKPRASYKDTEFVHEEMLFYNVEEVKDALIRTRI